MDRLLFHEFRGDGVAFTTGLSIAMVEWPEQSIDLSPAASVALLTEEEDEDHLESFVLFFRNNIPN